MTRVFKKSCFALLLLVFGSVLLFDVGCYFLLPDFFSSRIFLGYRVGPLPDGGFGGGYSRYYYEAHPERGFDIGVNKHPRLHHVFNYPANYSYPIWSNSLGCFDHELGDKHRYIYLAGDSSTWGFTAFEKKFGTLLEARLGVPVLKCGVSHSGQLHQLSKMKQVVQRVGAPPAIVIAVWSPNDIVNDALYPHSTEVDGWLVDTVHLSPDGTIVKEGEDALKEGVNQQELVLRSRFKTLRSFLVKYSAAYNVLNRALSQTTFTTWFAQGAADQPQRQSFYDLQALSNRLPSLPYRDDTLAIRNKEAIVQMQAYADSVGARFIIVLLAWHLNQTAEVRGFLEEKGIRFLDVQPSTFTFSEKSLTWRIDPHPNEDGNAAIARAIGDYISAQGLVREPFVAASNQ